MKRTKAAVLVLFSFIFNDNSPAGSSYWRKIDFIGEVHKFIGEKINLLAIITC
jgi:hypothetical protein